MDIVILGATGSIGRQCFDVVQNLPNVRVVGMAARSNETSLMEMADVLKPRFVTLYDRDGMEGLLECASMVGKGDLVVNAIVGSIGLRPTLAAIGAGAHIALANKETLVAAGGLVTSAAKEQGVEIRPMDSEHSAIWQCLQSSESDKNSIVSDVKRLIITASGGAFRELSREQIEKAKAADALKHPNWNMGQKITIDCATMMNKGLEYIEAHWLFGLPYDKIDILVHPQSVIHSMVEFEDGATLAQLAAPDMRQPIQYALTYPKRPKRNYEYIDFTKPLTFSEPDYERFPCLSLAMQAAEIGDTMPAMVNALNEQLVSAYLDGKVGFYDISAIIEKAMGAYTTKQVLSVEDVEEAEAWAIDFHKKMSFSNPL